MTNQEKVTIEVSKELYDAIQQLKQIFTQLTGQEVKSDEDVIGILVSGFIESLMQQQGLGGQAPQGPQTGNQNNPGGGIIIE